MPTLLWRTNRSEGSFLITSMSTLRTNRLPHALSVAFSGCRARIHLKHAPRKSTVIEQNQFALSCSITKETDQLRGRRTFNAWGNETVTQLVFHPKEGYRPAPRGLVPHGTQCDKPIGSSSTDSRRGTTRQNRRPTCFGRRTSKLARERERPIQHSWPTTS